MCLKMKISRIVIKNFKMYKSLDVEISNMNNILVGNNGTGKTTLLEAIYMCLNGRIHNQSIEKMLTVNLFNFSIQKKFKEDIKSKGNLSLPEIIIEIYFDDDDLYAQYKGVNNTKALDLPGIQLKIAFDKKFEEEYKERLNSNDADFSINNIPMEYYLVERNYFSSQRVLQRTNPFRAFFVDGTRKSYANYVGQYIYSSLSSILDDHETSKIKAVYESIRQKLKDNDILKNINQTNKESLTLAGKNVSLTVRESMPDEWLDEITVNVDEFPFDDIGFGLQKIIEMELAVGKSNNHEGILLFEEPENNLSFSNMSKLVSLIEQGNDKQKFISTHSSFVANKLGLNDLLLCESGTISSFTAIDKDDFNYFKKLPGYDTLRLFLAQKIVLVEGPTDELIFNRAYKDKTNRLPIEDGVDVFVVDSLAFKRYLNLCRLVNKEVAIITDNDGNENKFKTKYGEYLNDPLYKFFVEGNYDLSTIEPSVVDANKCSGTLDTLKEIVDKSNRMKTTNNIEKDLTAFMTKHKSEWALRVFDSDSQLHTPII